MRIGGEAPGRRAHSRKRYRHHGLLRVTATSDRQRRPTISCSSGSACPCLRRPLQVFAVLFLNIASIISILFSASTPWVVFWLATLVSAMVVFWTKEPGGS